MIRAINHLLALGVMVALVPCTACGIDDNKTVESRVGSTTLTMTVIIYLSLESEATRQWKDQGKRSPSEARFELSQNEPITTWWNSEEPMQLPLFETEKVFFGLATSSQQDVTVNIFVGESPAPQVSVLLAYASKAAIATDRSLIVKKQFAACGPSGL